MYKYATLDPTVWNKPNPVPVDVIQNGHQYYTVRLFLLGPDCKD